MLFFPSPHCRLKECSRWPECQDCGQDCLQQIEADPENCLVWTIVARWYEGNSCVFSHKQIDRLHHLDHAPALLGPDFRAREWKEVRAEQLPDIFFTHQPVCWNCECRGELPANASELVVDRERDCKRIRQA